MTPTAPPRKLFLHVTKACNLRCRYCYFSAREPLPDELTAADFRSVWPDVVALGPHKAVFTGGEPLLRADLLELLRDLRAADPGGRVRRCLNTNGHLVTPGLARELIGLADEVRVSLDGLGPANDALRGRGNFDAAVLALDALRAAGFEPKVLVTLTAAGVPGLEEFLCFLYQRGVTRVNLTGVRPAGRGAWHPEWRADAAAVEEAVRRAWRRCYPGRPVPVPPARPEGAGGCGVGRYVNVMPDGDVYPCHVLTDPAFRCGNLRDQSLLDICRSAGLLGRLAGLDFRALARADAAVSPVAQPGTCLGEVYAQTKSSAAWRTALPLVLPDRP